MDEHEALAFCFREAFIVVVVVAASVRFIKLERFFHLKKED